MGYILAIDQGTTSSRALLFDGNMRVVATGQEEFEQEAAMSCLHFYDYITYSMLHAEKDIIKNLAGGFGL